MLVPWSRGHRTQGRVTCLVYLMLGCQRFCPLALSKLLTSFSSHCLTPALPSFTSSLHAFWSSHHFLTFTSIRHSTQYLAVQVNCRTPNFCTSLPSPSFPSSTLFSMLPHLLQAILGTQNFIHNDKSNCFREQDSSEFTIVSKKKARRGTKRRRIASSFHKASQSISGLWRRRTMEEDISDTATTADKIGQCTQKVRAIFPDICLDYLQTVAGTKGYDADTIIHHIIDAMDLGHAYPKRLRGLPAKRKRDDEQDDEESLATKRRPNDQSLRARNRGRKV